MNAAKKLAEFLLEDEGSWVFDSRLDLSLRRDNVIGLPDNVAFVGGTARIRWQLDISKGAQGVDGMRLAVLDVQATLDCDDYDEPEETRQRLNVSYSAGHGSERPDNEDDPKEMLNFYSQFSADAAWDQTREPDDTTVFPKSLDIDLKRNHIVVKFG